MAPHLDTRKEKHLEQKLREMEVKLNQAEEAKRRAEGSASHFQGELKVISSRVEHLSKDLRAIYDERDTLRDKLKQARERASQAEQAVEEARDETLLAEQNAERAREDIDFHKEEARRASEEAREAREEVQLMRDNQARWIEEYLKSPAYTPLLHGWALGTMRPFLSLLASKFPSRSAQILEAGDLFLEEHLSALDTWPPTTSDPPLERAQGLREYWPAGEDRSRYVDPQVPGTPPAAPASE